MAANIGNRTVDPGAAVLCAHLAAQNLGRGGDGDLHRAVAHGPDGIRFGGLSRGLGAGRGQLLLQFGAAALGLAQLVLHPAQLGSDLAEEVFGPLGLVVRAQSPEDMERLARGFPGQLTATLHTDPEDAEIARRLLPILAQKAGRVLANGFPTGVEVADAMVHGGPYPASTNFGATSVGTLSIRRFLRPVSFQNLPDYLVEGDLA